MRAAMLRGRALVVCGCDVCGGHDRQLTQLHEGACDAKRRQTGHGAAADEGQESRGFFELAPGGAFNWFKERGNAFTHCRA